MILVIDNYDSFTWNLVHYVEQAGARTRVVRNDELTVDEALALKPSGVILSPGPCTPREAGICVNFIKQAPDDLPILGVCLGHQSIGDAYGEPVVQAGAILHGKVSTIRPVSSRICLRPMRSCAIIPSPFRGIAFRKRSSPTHGQTTVKSWPSTTVTSQSTASSSTRNRSEPNTAMN